MADLIVFRKDGTTRNSGWTYYGAKSEGADTASITPNSSPPAPSTVTSPTSAANAQSVIAAIRATSTRHERNRALIKAGLSRPQWHDLFQALIEAESNYHPTARSPKGAYGLGQLMPATARALGVDRRNMAQNLDGAAHYLLAQLVAFENVEFGPASLSCHLKRSFVRSLLLEPKASLILMLNAMENGPELLSKGLISAGYLSGQKARVLLLCTLATGCTGVSVHTEFLVRAFGDITD